MSGDTVVFVGDQMAAIIEALAQVSETTGDVPVVIGGLAVLSRLSTPYRATTDLDVVDRLRGGEPHLSILRRVPAARDDVTTPAAVFLPTSFGEVKVDVIEVRQIELDEPSDIAGDRLHASSHAWAHECATAMTLSAHAGDGRTLSAVVLVAEPGPLIAMKLQALEDRSFDKMGTDLQDIVRLTFDEATRSAALDQLSLTPASLADDIREHVGRWLVDRRVDALRYIQQTGGSDITPDDIDLAAELLLDALGRSSP